jgi:hypothetical protein
MSNVVTESMRDPATPDDVVVTATAREPVTDPTLAIAVAAAADAAVPPNRLVTIGDSLTQGFQSGAVFHTDLSWPAIVAWELGWYDQFRKPVYGGLGGLPLNIELLLRDLEHRFGADLDWWEFPLALFQGRQFMDSVEDYWERGPGSSFPNVTGINHILAIYGWDVRDTLERTWASSQAQLKAPKDDLISQLVDRVRDLAVVQPRAEPADLAVAAVGNQHRRAEFPAGELVEHVQHQLPLGPVVDAVGQLAGRPPAGHRGLVPGLGTNSRQSSGQEACSATALTDTPSWQLATLPRVPEYCRWTPTEQFPSLGKPVSSTAHAVGFQLGHQPLGQAAAHRPPVPRRGRHKVVQRLVVHLTEPGGHRLDRLTAAVQHQPAQVARATRTLVLARQRGEDVVAEGF